MKIKYSIIATFFLISSFIKPSLAADSDQDIVLPDFGAISTAVAMTVAQQLLKARILGFYKMQAFGYPLLCPIGNDIPVTSYNTFLISIGIGIGITSILCPPLPDNADVGQGDLNGDGFPDIISVGNGPNSVWFNNGSNGFTDSGQSLGNSNSASVTVIDLNNDGHLDVVIGNLDQPNAVYLNDGTGFLIKADIGQFFSGTGNTPDADPTNGWVFISKNRVIQTRYGEPVIIWNRVPGTIQFEPEILEPGNTNNNTTGSCIHEEKNGDKYMAITKWNQTDSLFFIENSPTPVFQELDIGSAKTNSQGCHFGDFNDDSFIDFLADNYGQGNTIHTNKGDNTYTQTTMTSTHNTTATASVDLNNDGQVDILEAWDDSDPNVSPLHYWFNQSITTAKVRARWVEHLEGEPALELDLNCGSSKGISSDIFLVAERISDGMLFGYSPLVNNFMSAPVITPTLPLTPCFTLDNFDLPIPTDVLMGDIETTSEEFRIYFGIDFDGNSQLDLHSLSYDTINLSLTAPF